MVVNLIQLIVKKRLILMSFFNLQFKLKKDVSFENLFQSATDGTFGR